MISYVTLPEEGATPSIRGMGVISVYRLFEVDNGGTVMVKSYNRRMDLDGRRILRG
jgi:hypothetical protein